MNQPLSANDLRSTRRTFLQGVSTVALGGSCAQGPLQAATTASAPVTKPPALMQIGILLSTFVRPPLEARLDVAKAAGLVDIQLALDCAGLPTMPDKLPPDLAGRLRREAAARDITIASLQGTFNMCHPDAEHRASPYQSVFRVVDFADVSETALG